MVGSAGGDEFVARESQRARLCPFLQGGLRVARRPLHFVDQRLPEPAHEARSGLEAAVEVNRRDQGLANIGENSRVGGGPRRLFGARQEQMVSEPDRLGDARERFATNEMRQSARQVPLGLAREAPP